MSDTENLVLTLLREMRGEIGEVRSELTDVREHMATTSDTAALRIEIAASEKRLGERIAHLNRAVMEYHSSAIGHGVLFTEIEERLRRVEQHLKLPPADSH